jgi:hypothetical protein
VTSSPSTTSSELRRYLSATFRVPADPYVIEAAPHEPVTATVARYAWSHSTPRRGDSWDVPLGAVWGAPLDETPLWLRTPRTCGPLPGAGIPDFNASGEEHFNLLYPLGRRGGPPPPTCRSEIDP